MKNNEKENKQPPPPPRNFGRGGGGVGRFLFQGFDPLPTQRVPLCTILRYPFLLTDPKSFLKAPLAPIYTNFERGALFLAFLSKVCLRRKKFGQNSVFFENPSPPPPPREIPRSAPGLSKFY